MTAIIFSSAVKQCIEIIEKNLDMCLQEKKALKRACKQRELNQPLPPLPSPLTHTHTRTRTRTRTHTHTLTDQTLRFPEVIQQSPMVRNASSDS